MCNKSRPHCVKVNLFLFYFWDSTFVSVFKREKRRGVDTKTSFNQLDWLLFFRIFIHEKYGITNKIFDI